MGNSVIIRTPIPTAEEVADRLGLSQKRRAFLRKLAESAKTPEPEKRAATRSKLRKVLASRKAA
jgi:hypothetical protein